MARAGPGWLFLVALVTITLIGPLAVHMYIPIMPTIQLAFGVSTVLTTLTFSMVLFVMSFGTLYTAVPPTATDASRC